MFTSPQSAQAEIAYRQERIKREFGRAAVRQQRRKQATEAESRPARRSLRPKHGA